MDLKAKKTTYELGASELIEVLAERLQVPKAAVHLEFIQRDVAGPMEHHSRYETTGVRIIVDNLIADSLL